MAIPALIIAHRGASGHAPEHTFAAYDLALEMGADYLEQDLQMTSDGELVVLHDETLDRTTDGTGPVRQHTLAEIEALVPTLEQVFDRYGSRARYYIETKSPETYPGMEEALLALIERHRLGARVIIQSFSPESLRRVHELDPSLPLVQLLPRGASEPAHLPLAGIGPSMADVDAGSVAAAHEQGLVVHPYTVNETADMRRLLALGVDGMFTDFPDRLRALLRR